jgi:hypothetical protein
MDDAVILMRAIRLANIGMKTVALQLRRTRGVKPEDDDFVFRRLVDIRFYIISLNRLRTTSTIGYNVSNTKSDAPSCKQLGNLIKHYQT